MSFILNMLNNHEFTRKQYFLQMHVFKSFLYAYINRKRLLEYSSFKKAELCIVEVLWKYLI